jgi:Transposase DDE domain group 1
MDDATGEAEGSGLRVAFDRRLKLEFHGATVTSDAGLLAFRELDDALGLTALAAEVLADTRTGRNGRHSLIAQLRQSVFGRLAGYEDVNDADRLGRDPALKRKRGYILPCATAKRLQRDIKSDKLPLETASKQLDASLAETDVQPPPQLK